MKIVAKKNPAHTHHDDDTQLKLQQHKKNTKRRRGQRARKKIHGKTPVSLPKIGIAHKKNFLFIIAPLIMLSLCVEMMFFCAFLVLILTHEWDTPAAGTSFFKHIFLFHIVRLIVAWFQQRDHDYMKLQQMHGALVNQ